MAEIEKESTDKTGLRSDVVTLYQGGQYHLYTYKKYTDVRLVFAPEFATAFFGGDPDNFEYPRYDLDVCFFRAYENGKPARPPHYLKWSKNGSKDGDLVFVAGHPGRTDRLNTVASLEYLRDVVVPRPCSTTCTRRRPSCSSTASAGPEAFRQSKEELFSDPEQPQGPGRRPGRPARRGVHGPQGPGGERASLSESRADPKKKAAYGAAWDRIAQAQKVAAEIAQAVQLPRRSAGFAFDSELFKIARHLVRLAEEKPKPNSERLKEYRDSALQSLELAALLRGPDLSRVRGGQARPLAGLLEEAHARRPAGRAGLCGAERPKRPRRTFVREYQARRRRRAARSSPRAARRRSRAATTR